MDWFDGSAAHERGSWSARSMAKAVSETAMVRILGRVSPPEGDPLAADRDDTGGHW